jgi:cytidylate kinase
MEESGEGKALPRNPTLVVSAARYNRRQIMAVITISREYGSRGNDVARLICERLGYRYFDKDLMAQLGAQIGLAPDKIADLPEHQQHHARSHVERLFAAMPLMSGEMAGWGLAARAEVDEQMERMSIQTVESLIRAAHEQDKVVVVGRAGQVVLRDLPDVFHVRVVAPIEQRIQRVQQSEGLTADAARELVHRRDRDMADYVKSFYDADRADPLLYDMVINTSKITPPVAAELIVKALEGLPVPARPK